MKIAIVGRNIVLSETARKTFTRCGQVELFDLETSSEHMASAAESADALITPGRISRDLLDKLPRLRFVCIMLSGYEAALDASVTREYAESRGLALSYTPGASAHAVAEYTLGGMLACLRFITRPAWAFQEIPQGWFKGISFQSLTAGIVGLGSVGIHLAWLLDSLGIAALGCTRRGTKRPDLPARLLLTGFEEVCRRSDAIAVTCSLNESTRGMFNAVALGSLKPSVILVNAARPEIFDLDALFEFLSENAAARVLLDDSNAVQGHRLLELPNFHATPHIAFNTQEALDRYGEMAAENLVAFIEGVPVNEIPLR